MLLLHSLSCLIVTWLPCGETSSFPTLYNPVTSVNNYYTSPHLQLPDTGFTLCYWWKYTDDTLLKMLAGPVGRRPFTITVNPDTAARLAIVQTDQQVKVLYEAANVLELSHEVSQNWEYQCVSITKQYLLSYYAGGHVDGVMKIEEMGNVTVPPPNLASSSNLVVYQRKGGSSEKQASSGWMYCLNIWRGTFTTEQLVQRAECADIMKGNLFSLTLDAGTSHGDVTWSSVTPFNDPSLRRPYATTPTLYNPRASLTNYYAMKSAVILPASSYTICFWHKYEQDTADSMAANSSKVSPVINFVSKTSASNQLGVYQALTKIGFLYHNIEEMEIDVPANILLVYSWQYHCVMVKPGPVGNSADLTYYVKEENSLTWSFTEGVFVTSNSIQNDVYLLEIYQDLYGEQFKSQHTSSGWISCLNIWSSTFSSDELLQFAKCDATGDLFTLQEGQGYKFGEVKWTDEESPIPEEGSGSGSCSCG